MAAPPFRLFGPDHLAALAVTALVCAAVPAWARRLPPERRAWVRAGIGVLLIGYAVAAYVRLATAPGVGLMHLLPLHLCDVLLVAALLAVFRLHPAAFEITYFWGLAGALPAMVTPDLARGYPSFAYCHFFWGHGGIVLAVVFLIAGEGMQPRAGGVLRAVLAANLYLVVVGTIDWITGWNYGYLRRPPAGDTLLGRLGPWPWYIVWLQVIGIAAFLILDLPWRMRRKARGHTVDA
jgi:hypothetical integral membrane protein (TIGR02206 family)